ncbi:hypothetical protein [Helicobacter pylori]|uniref:hypothetical protein n=1 Tax=Helicobacter pylori TaxID=210 RepID=UPI0009898896|nr:hypothetical protein [Helicobacter pylori]OOC25129.1 hypothetical protein BZK20_07125 [Helicobacter pylori]
MELSELENEILKRLKNTILKNWYPIRGIEPYKTNIIAKKEKEFLQETKEEKEEWNAFPFNKYEHMLVFLIAKGYLKYKEYKEIRNNYLKSNPYLYLFEKSSSQFGKFAENFIIEKCPKLKKASKELDNNYSKQYDLFLEGITIEVKASKVANNDSNKTPLFMRALPYNTNKNFEMNFQQLKPQCAEIFIFLAVFLDEIILWVLNSKEVLSHKDYSIGQHRGNKGEGQLHITQKNIHTLDKYQLKNDNLEQMISEAKERLELKHL